MLEFPVRALNWADDPPRNGFSSQRTCDSILHAFQGRSRKCTEGDKWLFFNGTGDTLASWCCSDTSYPLAGRLPFEPLSPTEMFSAGGLSGARAIRGPHSEHLPDALLVHCICPMTCPYEISCIGQNAHRRLRELPKSSGREKRAWLLDRGYPACQVLHDHSGP